MPGLNGSFTISYHMHKQIIEHTVNYPKTGTHRSEQTVQTQIRLLLKSDQGLHILAVHLHLLNVVLNCETCHLSF